MKKFIYSALAAIGLLLSPSCSDENEVLSGSDNEALVSFNVNLADGMSTKAISDGETATELYVKVFNGDGTCIEGLGENPYNISGKSATVNLNLVKGKTYKFLFWAQSSEADAFSLEGNTVKVLYPSTAKANDENRDAFYYSSTKTITGSFEENVTLKRPFAQLNFLTTADDIKAAIKGGLPVNKTSITISSAAQILSPSFDLNTKPSVSDAQENVNFDFEYVRFTVSDDNVSSASTVYIDANGTTVPSSGEGITEYFYLATTYFLVNNSEDATAQALVDVNMKVEGAEGDGLSVQSVPVCMNYRTNIYGNLLTASGTYHVTIDNNFDDNYNEYQESVEVSTIDQIEQAISGGASTITVTNAPTDASTITIPMVADGVNKNIILNLPALTSEITINASSI